MFLGLFWRIHHVEPSDLAILYGIVSLIATYGISFAYRNTKFQLKHGFAQEREDAIRKEMNSKLSNDKKMSRKEKDERILWKKNEVADYEATSYSIFYNNALFLSIFLFASFLLLRNFSPVFNYILSICSSVGIIALLSTATK